MYACLATIQCVQHLDLTKACSMEHCERGKSNQRGDWGWPAEITLEKRPTDCTGCPEEDAHLGRFLLHLFPSSHYCIFHSLFSSPSLSPSFLSFNFFFSEITFTTRVGGCYMLWPLQINFCARKFSQHFYATLIYLTELNETE